MIVNDELLIKRRSLSEDSCRVLLQLENFLCRLGDNAQVVAATHKINVLYVISIRKQLYYQKQFDTIIEPLQIDSKP